MSWSSSRLLYGEVFLAKRQTNWNRRLTVKLSVSKRKGGGRKRDPEAEVLDVFQKKRTSMGLLLIALIHLFS